MVTDMATMVTMARDLLMKLPLLNLAPTPMPKPTPGMVIMVTGTGLTVMVTMATGITDTMARDLLMKLPLLNLAPTPMPKPTPGMVIMVMGTMVLDTVVTTGDKKWTSRTTSDLSLPTHL